MKEQDLPIFNFLIFRMPKLKMLSSDSPQKLIEVKNWLDKNCGSEFLFNLANRIKDEKEDKVIKVTWQLETLDF